MFLHCVSPKAVFPGMSEPLYPLYVIELSQGYYTFFHEQLFGIKTHWILMADGNADINNESRLW